jgi:3-hydroxyisobutyrate dehydrogenase
MTVSDSSAGNVTPVGFIGIGNMGEPMALNLVRAGTRVVAWNRTRDKTAALAAAGATIASDVTDVFAQAAVVILMLLDDKAIDAVLARGTPAFASRVKNHVIIHMATTAPAFSKALDSDIRAAGGRYVEAPVSGSRRPAELGQLVVMLAGEAPAIEIARPLLAPMCRDAIVCGPTPNALLMKLAVNLFMITMVTGLAEAVHFAASHDLDLDRLVSVLNAGPMASDISKIKVSKLVARDFGVQASITNVLESNRLITGAARNAGIASPLIDVCHALYGESMRLGLGGSDIAAVLRAIEERSAKS